MDTSGLPGWVDKLKKSYLAGGASMYILHGNVSDVIGSSDGSTYSTQPLADFLASRLFGNYDLVLHYDMGRGLRAFAAGDARRLTQMNSLLARIAGDVELPRDPTQCLRMLDRLISLLMVGQENRAFKTAILFDYADMICPADDREPEHLATFLNWARSPVVRKVNIVFALMAESLSALNPVLVQSGHTEEIFIPMPSESARAEFVQKLFPGYAAEASRLATMSAGLTLSNLERMMRAFTQTKDAPAQPAKEVAGETVAQAAEAKPGIGADNFAKLAALKKELMEAQCPGLLEFIEPKFDLTMIAGHTAAKERLDNDAKLIREGQLDAVPMGYLLCGPVGVGKTFLALCYAGSVGIPCVTIRNFRSKYVGETEANLERILTVVRELGPVAVIIDEADAAVGNRGASGDSGTSARVFAQLASQMGDTRFRGKVIWFMLTCRPDLLPVDLKRQGRCEEHIPLFYPQTADELKEMFVAMARKAKLTLPPEALPNFSKVPPLSGADIESVLTRTRRESLIRNKPVDAALIEEVLASFRSVKGMAHELQWLAAIMESSDLRYLPQDVRKVAEKPEGMESLTRRFHELSALEGE